MLIASITSVTQKKKFIFKLNSFKPNKSVHYNETRKKISKCKRVASSKYIKIWFQNLENVREDKKVRSFDKIELLHFSNQK